MTRRVWIACGQVALLVVWIGVPASAMTRADPDTRLRTYEGTTSAGDTVTITTAPSRRGVRLVELGFGWTLACQDGQGFPMGFGIGFGNGPVQEPARIDLDLVSTFDALHLHGRLGAHRGSGTLSYARPALTADEQPQTCATGDLTWRVERTSGTTTSTRALSQRVLTTRPSPGVVRTVVSGPAPTATEGRVRHYDARTSQGTTMRFRTVKSGDGVALRGLDVELTLSCDDRTEAEVGAGYGFFPGQAMEPGHIDLDDATLDQALHVHGGLGAHLGSGTVTMIWPAFAQDEQPQLCAARDVGWTAWRTDPGAGVG